MNEELILLIYIFLLIRKRFLFNGILMNLEEEKIEIFCNLRYLFIGF